MIKVIDFTTEEKKKTIIAEQAALGFRLLEEQYYLNGNHLVFSDELKVWQAEWDATTNVDDKAKVLARMLGLKVA